MPNPRGKGEVELVKITEYNNTPNITDTQQVQKKIRLPFKAHIPQDFFVATAQEIRLVSCDSEAQILGEPTNAVMNQPPGLAFGHLASPRCYGKNNSEAALDDVEIHGLLHRPWTQPTIYPRVKKPHSGTEV